MRMVQSQDSEPPDLAVLIDGDNVAPSHIDAVLTATVELGNVRIRRVYATADHLRGWSSKSKLHGIEPRVVEGTRNAADDALAADSRELRAEQSLAGFVIVSSDRDFVDLIRELKRTRLVVYGFGRRAARTTLKQACDAYFCVEDLPSARGPRVTTTVPRKPTGSRAPAKRRNPRRRTAEESPLTYQRTARKRSSARQQKRQDWDLRQRQRQLARAARRAGTRGRPTRATSPFLACILTHLGQLPARLMAIAVPVRQRNDHHREQRTEPPDVRTLLTQAYHAAPKRKGGWVELGRLSVAAHKLSPDGRFRPVANGRFGVVVQRSRLFDVQGGVRRPDSPTVRGNFLVRLRVTSQPSDEMAPTADSRPSSSMRKVV